MLKNDPPPGTNVRFTSAPDRRAVLVGPVRKYYVDRPEDEFQIELPDGRRQTVRREQIELVE
jgi:hypothetical protein